MKRVLCLGKVLTQNRKDLMQAYHNSITIVNNKKFFIHINIDTVNMKNGFAFVEFEDRRDAKDAVNELNGKQCDGYRVIVDHARGPGGGDRGGGGYRGGGGGYRGGGDRGYGGRGRSPPRGGGYRGGGGGGGYGRGRSRSPPKRSEHRLVIKNLSSRVFWQDLKDLFRPMGEVTYADAHTKIKNQGVIEFAREKDMLKALDNMQGKDVQGREIELSEERKQGGRVARSPSRSSSSRSRSPVDRKRRRSPSGSPERN